MRILFCWELGAGSGHLELVGATAQRLRERGHEIVFASRHLGAAAHYSRTSGLELVQAPLTWPPPVHANAISLPDMLHKFGWSDTRTLRSLVRAWAGIFESTRAELIIAEHSPTALLAARAVNAPVRIVGTGFFVPPARVPMPAFFDGPGVDTVELERLEREVVSTANRILREHGAQRLGAFAELYSPSSAFLATYPDFDHYGARPGTRYHGTADQRQLGESPGWPDGSGEKVFVYMHPDYPQFAVMLEQLARLDLPALVVAPGFHAAQLSRIDTPRLQVRNEHVNLDEVAAQCGLVICHASHGTVARILRRGIPPILVPHYVEQTMLAHRLARAGLAFAAHPDPARHDYAVMFDAALRGEAQHERARQFAADNPPEGAAARFDAMVDAMLAGTSNG